MIRPLTIIEVLNGYSVRIGCQDIVFENRDRLLSELCRYLETPDIVEQEYRDRYGQVNQCSNPDCPCPDPEQEPSSIRPEQQPSIRQMSQRFEKR